MRVAVFHNLPSGGAKRAMIEMIRQLRLAGDTVDVFAPSTADEHFFPSAAVASSVRIWPADDSPVVGRERRNLRIPDLGRRLRRAATVQRRIASAIDADSYDVAFVHHCRFTQSPWVLRHLETPSVYFCQEPYRIVYEERRRPASRRVRIRLWAPGIGIARIDRANISSANMILANSFYSRESILRAYGLESSVVYLGVDAQLFRPGREAANRYVVSVGAITPFKGHRLVVEALGRIPGPRRPGLRVIGDRHASGEEAILHRLAEANDVDITIETGLTDAELVAAYQSARLAVCASELEPFGLVALEAAACGTPVVAIREGGLREAVEQDISGLLVDDRHPATLGSAIDDLMADDRRLARMRKSAVEMVRSRWSWERTGRLLREQLQATSVR